MPYGSRSTTAGYSPPAVRPFAGWFAPGPVGRGGRPDEKRIRVLVVQDMDLIRGALVALLSQEPDIAVVGELARGDAVVDTAARLGSDIAVVDSELPGIDGFEVAGRLYAKLPSCRALILTGPGSPSALRRAVDVHAWGYMLKHAPARRLADAVRRISQGERVIDSDSAVQVISASRTPLTEREVVILRLVGEGAPLPDIAAKLFLSTGTVRNYLSSAIRKSAARNRIDAVRIARESGWI